MFLLPSPAVTYATHLAVALAFCAMGYAFRTSLSRYFRKVLPTASNEAPVNDLVTLALAAGGVVAVVIVILGFPPSLAALVGGGVFAGTPRVVRNRRRLQYMKDFDAALCESLQTVASSLKAGLTLRDALQVATETAAPAFAREVAVALKEYRFGKPIDEALDLVRKRVATPNANIAFGSMIIASRLGGRLPEMLSRIVSTIRERQRVEGKLKALTAQGRAQAFLLCSAPPVLGIGMYLYDPSKMRLMTDSLVGQVLLALAIILEVVGIFVTSRVMKLEV